MKYLLALVLLSLLLTACGQTTKTTSLDDLSPDAITEDPDLGTIAPLAADTTTDISEVKESNLPDVPADLVEDNPDLGALGDLPVINDDLV